MHRTIYFVRHCQTVSNITGQVQGPDDPLSNTGTKQTLVIAERAKKLDFERIISSDYSRAKITAEAIQSATGKPLTFSDLFREFRRPSQFWGKIPAEDSEVLASYMLMNEHFADENWRLSDEENFFDLKARGIDALNYLLVQGEQRLLVVTHGNFLRNLLGIMLRGEKEYSTQDYLNIESTFELGNASVTLVKYQHHWRKDAETWMVESWNDHAHLGELK